MDSTFKRDIIPPNEADRVAALKRYKIIGTDAEKSFESVARLVAEIFHISITMISLVDADYVYFRSGVGLTGDKSPRGESFCSLTVLEPAVKVIEDALNDPIVCDSPLVKGEFGLRFYAGAPLITHDGFLIGSVCMVDTQPRTFGERDRDILAGMAKVVMDQMELRLKNIDEIEQQLQASREAERTAIQLRLAVDAARIGTWHIRPGNMDLEYNEVVAQIFGFEGAGQMTYEQAIGQVTDEYRPLILKEIDAAIAGEGSYDFTYQQRRFNDNKLLWLRSLGKITADENGDYTLFSGVVIDVTEQVKAQASLEEVNNELATINEELTAANEELAGVNEEQASSNEELRQSQESLHAAIKTLAASEAKMDQIIEQLPASISVITGYDLVVERTNASNLNYWQKKREETIGRPLLKVLPELANQAFPGQLRGVLETGEMIVQYEWPVHLVDNDGNVQTTYVDYSYQAVTDEEGKRTGVLVMSNDVTEQVDARHKLEQSEEELKKINAELAQSSSDLLFTIDAAGLGTFDLNPLTGRFTGNDLLKSWFGLRPEEEIPLQAATDVIAEADRDYVIKAIAYAMDYNSQGKYDVEYAIINPYHPEPRYVRAKGKVLFNDEQQAIRLSGTVQDITEQKKDDQRKNDFIGMVSHELKTPLTSLSAIVQIANVKLKSSTDTFLAGAMEKANIQVGKMTKMINGFLNISRLESGKIAIVKQKFSLNDLMREAIDEAEIISPGSPIEMVTCPEITVYADRDKIGSVIANIINNAIKYSPKAATIFVKCEVKNGSAIVSIKDEGVGINPADAEKLFDRYYRVDNPNTKHISGFGIGLYLSAEIIGRHDGRIWVESELDKGSTFYFSLPLA